MTTKPWWTLQCGSAQEGENECLYMVFFFQAEDGIRDYKVTGVQTCALPIFQVSQQQGICRVRCRTGGALQAFLVFDSGIAIVWTCGPRCLSAPARQGCAFADRSEERRVGKECRSRWSPYH